MSRTVAIALALFAWGCGSSSSGDARSTTSSGDAGSPDAIAIVDGGDPGGPAPAFRFEEEPASDCTATTTAPKKVVATGGAVLSDLEVAGDRLLARLFAGTGVITFARDGSDATTPIAVGSDARAAASANGLLVAGVEEKSGELAVGAFDVRGVPAGAAQILGPMRAGRSFTIARSDDLTLTTWVAPPFELRARVLDGTAVPGAPFRLEFDAEFDDLSIVAAPSPTKTDASAFLVVWSLRRIALSSHRVYTALVGKGGVVGLPRLLFGGNERLTVTKLVTREGAATLLANRDGEPLVVPLDALGRPTAAPARLFHGARDANVGGGQGLAFGNDRIALVAAHSSGAHALRIVDRDAKPQGGWVCLDAPSPDGFQLGSVITDGAGWKTMIATSDGSALLDVDLAGMHAR